MGAEQSREGSSTTGFKRTEIANFDFRDDKFSKSGIQQRQRSSNERYNNNDRKIGGKEDNFKSRNSSNDNRNNAYWLEVGMDVVKRLENDDNRFYTS